MKFDLVKPSLNYQESCLEVLDELSPTDPTEYNAFIYNDWTPAQVRADYAGYVNDLLARETHPKAPMVADTTLWAVQGNQVLGRISLRHSLTPYLRNIGGHIGYFVRPSSRRQGIGSQMLPLLLSLPKAQEIGRLFVTCDETNIASIKIIERNGGKRSGTYQDPSKKVTTLQYWIEI